MRNQQKIHELTRQALLLQGHNIHLEDVAAICLTYEKIKEKKGNFSLADSTEITKHVEELYDVDTYWVNGDDELEYDFDEDEGISVDDDDYVDDAEYHLTRIVRHNGGDVIELRIDRGDGQYQASIKETARISDHVLSPVFKTILGDVEVREIAESFSVPNVNFRSDEWIINFVKNKKEAQDELES